MESRLIREWLSHSLNNGSKALPVILKSRDVIIKDETGDLMRLLSWFSKEDYTTAYVNSHTGIIDPNLTLVLEGRRQMLQFLKGLINLSEQDIINLTNKGGVNGKSKSTKSTTSGEQSRSTSYDRRI